MAAQYEAGGNDCSKHAEQTNGHEYQISNEQTECDGHIQKADHHNKDRWKNPYF